MATSLPLQARVEHGRLVLDEPIDLPDGTMIDLVPADVDERLDEEDQRRLDAAIERGIADADAGRTVPAAQVIAALRARRR